MKFHIPINPPTATAQQQKTAVIGGKVRKYDPKNVKAAKSDLFAALFPYRPEQPLEGPLSVRINWVYPFLKKHYGKRFLKADFFDGHPCDTRPDVDNLIKGLFDVMTRCGFWRDDSQVAELYFAKCYGHCVGIWVEIEEVKGIEYGE
jgi:Holliday junction resolvase RusA-like endonuclease